MLNLAALENSCSSLFTTTAARPQLINHRDETGGDGAVL